MELREQTPADLKNSAVLTKTSWLKAYEEEKERFVQASRRAWETGQCRYIDHLMKAYEELGYLLTDGTKNPLHCYVMSCASRLALRYWEDPDDDFNDFKGHRHYNARLKFVVDGNKSLHAIVESKWTYPPPTQVPHPSISLMEIMDQYPAPEGTREYIKNCIGPVMACPHLRTRGYETQDDELDRHIMVTLSPHCPPNPHLNGEEILHRGDGTHLDPDNPSYQPARSSRVLCQKCQVDLEVAHVPDQELAVTCWVDLDLHQTGPPPDDGEAKFPHHPYDVWNYGEEWNPATHGDELVAKWLPPCDFPRTREEYDGWVKTIRHWFLSREREGAW